MVCLLAHPLQSRYGEMGACPVPSFSFAESIMVVAQSLLGLYSATERCVDQGQCMCEVRGKRNAGHRVSDPF